MCAVPVESKWLDALGVSAGVDCALQPDATGFSNPLASSNHCIGTCHTVIDLIFRFLESKYAASGGNLSGSALAEVRKDLIDGMQSMLDFFDSIHCRCMCASGVGATRLFVPGHMLPSLLYVASRKAAEDAFSKASKLDYRHLSEFYVALAKVLRRHIGRDIEARLTSAYIRASIKFGQALNVDKLLQEPEMSDALQACLQLFETPVYRDTLLACLNDAVENTVKPATDTNNAEPNEKPITTMQKFLERFPQEVQIAIGEQYWIG